MRSERGAHTNLFLHPSRFEGGILVHTNNHAFLIEFFNNLLKLWMPAFAGMTHFGNLKMSHYPIHKTVAFLISFRYNPGELFWGKIGVWANKKSC